MLRKNASEFARLSVASVSAINLFVVRPMEALTAALGGRKNFTVIRLAMLDTCKHISSISGFATMLETWPAQKSTTLTLRI